MTKTIILLKMKNYFIEFYITIILELDDTQTTLRWYF